MEVDVYHLTSYKGTTYILVSTEVPQISQWNDDLWMEYWHDIENNHLQLGVWYYKSIIFRIAIKYSYHLMIIFVVTW